MKYILKWCISSRINTTLHRSYNKRSWDRVALYISFKKAMLFSYQAWSNCVHFWLEDWTGFGSLVARFPLIFELDKKNFVNECICSEGVNWKWKKTPSDSRDISKLVQLVRLISSFSVTNALDAWSSKICGWFKGFNRLKINKAGW